MICVSSSYQSIIDILSKMTALFRLDFYLYASWYFIYFNSIYFSPATVHVLFFVHLYMLIFTYVWNTFLGSYKVWLSYLGGFMVYSRKYLPLPEHLAYSYFNFLSWSLEQSEMFYINLNWDNGYSCYIRFCLYLQNEQIFQ